ncbi:MAG: tRNA (adenosine(37)-N6)-dimethylallyltransferase MiaA [Desulfobulbaceae bacterium]|nr:tRNA (adenosine(37)-N6)-dimethylallyltransferase MiaA [Desulfobulbaceae bacterium]
MKYNLVTILGPTASGKTRLGVYLSSLFNGEIISADSRQVYLGMDIGTGKDYDDYIFDNRKIPFHLIDIISPKEEYNLFRFKQDFIIAYSNILERGKNPFMVGGTGLYLSAILQNYKLSKVDFEIELRKKLEKLPIEELRDILLSLKPKLHNTTDFNYKERIIAAILIEKFKTEVNNHELLDYSVNSINIGVKVNRNEHKKLISQRLKKRLESGMIEEVERLLTSGITHEKLCFFGLEYKYVSLFIRKELSYNDMFQKLNSAINQFAKRQMTWFRKMEREGVLINWVDYTNSEEAEKNLISSGFDPQNYT